MSDSDSVVARANAILAMMSADEKEDVKRKTGNTDIVGTARALARLEHKSGARTAKVKLVKAMMKAAATPET